jgi:hypothetical protein
MKRILRELGEILIECVERQAFLFGAPSDGRPAAPETGEFVDATIRYAKDNLTVRLVTTPEFALALACGYCGEEPEEARARAEADPAEGERNVKLSLDATGEILNTVLGNYLYQFMYPYDTRDLSTPTARLRTAEEIARTAASAGLRGAHRVRLYVFNA